MNYSAKAGAAVSLLFLVICIGPVSGAVIVGGNIDSDTTWTADETIVVGSDVTITATGHLTIQPGAAVYFIPGTGMIVEGQLTADGAGGNHILFTAISDTAGGSPSAASWQGISFQETGSGSLHGCDIRYPNTCVQITGASPEFIDCNLTNFLSAGISIDDGGALSPITPTVVNCTIGQNNPTLLGTGKGIYVFGKVDIVITNSVIHDCLFGLEFYSSAARVPDFQITNSNIRSNAARGIYTHPG